MPFNFFFTININTQQKIRDKVFCAGHNDNFKGGPEGRAPYLTSDNHVPWLFLIEVHYKRKFCFKLCAWSMLLG